MVLVVKEFWILATNYFDDFVSISPSKESEQIQSCVHLFFRVLGWQFAASGDKAPIFSEIFQALGVNVNVSRLHGGLATLGNTESRRKELVSFFEGVLSKQKLTRVDALRCRGRLQVAAGNVFGGIAKNALSIVTAHAYHSMSSTLDSAAILAFTLHKRLLLEGRPRELRPSTGEVWYIQTDACYESQEPETFSGIGAVLFAPDGSPVKLLPSSWAKRCWTASPNAKKTAVFECENFALFCSFLLWSDSIGGSAVLYIDSNAVRDALITCHTTNWVARGWLISTLALECREQICPWYASVPQTCLMVPFDRVRQLGASCDTIDVEDCWAQHSALFAKWREHQAQCCAHRSK